MKNEEMVLRKRAHSFVDRVSEIKIRSQITLTRANNMIVRIRWVRKEIEEFFADPIDKAHKSKYAAAEAYKAIVLKKEEVEEPLNNAEALIKERIKTYLLAEEEKRAEAGQIAEQKRQESMEKAVGLREEGHHEEAEEIEDSAPQEFIKQKPRLTGLHTRDKWRYRVIDPLKIPRRYLIINEVMVNREVTEKKGATKIPGIEAYKDMIIAKSRY